MSSATVYHLSLNELGKLKDLLPEMDTPLALKTHFGEDKNRTSLSASLVEQISDIVDNPTMIETSVLYRGRRSRAFTHKELALENGFDFAPLDFLDGEEGDDSMEVNINGDHFHTCYLGGGLKKYDSLLVVSHFKGHVLSGFGGALKNLAMGLASRRGKLNQHESIKHQIEEEKCISCGICIQNCPVEAISWNDDGKAQIDTQICISCSKCISVCPQDAVNVPVVETASQTLQERIAEYAYAGSKDRECFYVNFLKNITEGCDCEMREMDPLVEDMGVLVSEDPVALDQASYDMVVEKYPDFERFKAGYMLQQAEKMGMGSREYSLEEKS